MVMGVTRKVIDDAADAGAYGVIFPGFADGLSSGKDAQLRRGLQENRRLH